MVSIMKETRHGSFLLRCEPRRASFSDIVPFGNAVPIQTICYKMRPAGVLGKNFVVRRPRVKADTPWQGASDRLSMIADLFRYIFRCGPRRWVLIGSDQIIVPPVVLIVRQPIFQLAKTERLIKKFMTATFAQT